MMDKLSHRGPDGSDSVYFNNVFLSHYHLWITPEEVEERQPLNNGSGSLFIIFDGRLDNRDELINLINPANKELENKSDASLLLLLYEILGDKSFEKLIGPYSVVIYDKNRKRVICARDPLAERGFFFHINKNLFIASSEEQAILSHPEVSKTLNEKNIAHYFAIEALRDGSTFFKDIRELLPGHILIFENKKAAAKKFHEFKPLRIRYGDDGEYAEHYRELLEKSVACRMRCSTPASIMLSGGMDSSSIVPFAVKHNPHKKKVRAISWTFNRLKECDEREYIDKTVLMYDLKKIQFNADTLWPLRDKELYFLNPSTPQENGFREIKQKTYSLCSQNGSRLLFNGWYSDCYYAGYDYWLSDLLKDCKFKRFGSDIKWLIKENGLTELYTNQPFRKIFKFLRFLKLKENIYDQYDWLSEYSKSQLYESLISQEDYNYFPNPKRALNMLSTTGFFGASSEHFHLSNHSIELDCPYRDIRLTQFMLNIPSYQLFNKGTIKYIAKNAMRNLLPPEILKRNSPTLLTPLYNLGLNKREVEYIRTVLNSSDEWTRYVNKKEVYATISNTKGRGRIALAVWQCLSFIAWLKSVRDF